MRLFLAALRLKILSVDTRWQILSDIVICVFDISENFFCCLAEVSA